MGTSVFRSFSFADRLEKDSDGLHGFLARIAIDGDDIEAPGQMKIIRILLFVTIATFHCSGKAEGFPMNPVGAEFHMVLLAGSLQNVIAQNVVRFIFWLSYLDVALKPAFLVEDRQRVFRRKKMILGRNVIDRQLLILSFEMAS